MNCPTCNTLMVKAQATNFGPTYDYCRGCKRELSEMQVPVAPNVPTSWMTGMTGNCFQSSSGAIVHCYGDCSPSVGARCNCGKNTWATAVETPSRGLVPSPPLFRCLHKNFDYVNGSCLICGVTTSELFATRATHNWKVKPGRYLYCSVCNQSEKDFENDGFLPCPAVNYKPSPAGQLQPHTGGQFPQLPQPVPQVNTGGPLGIDPSGYKKWKFNP